MGQQIGEELTSLGLGPAQGVGEDEKVEAGFTHWSSSSVTSLVSSTGLNGLVINALTPAF